MKTVNVEEREMQNVSENSLDLINQGSLANALAIATRCC